MARSGRRGTVVAQRDEIRDTASIVAMCELAEELAGGGDLEELRAELARVRIVEQPAGIDEAEDAALALDRCSALRRGSPRGLPRRGRRRHGRAGTGARGDVVAVLGGDSRRDRRRGRIRRARSSVYYGVTLG